MKKIKGYSGQDITILLTTLLIVTTSGLIFKSAWYIIISSILSLLCVFTQAKCKISTHFIGIIDCIFYVFIAYTQKYFGEIILYIFLMIPMYIYGIFHWLSHKDKENKVVIIKNKLSAIECTIFSFFLILISIGTYNLLKVLNTNNVLISTISFISMLPGIYLLVRRCKWNQIAFLINDFCAPILWLLLIIQGDYSFIPLIIHFIIQIGFDIMGLFQWIELENIQRNNKYCVSNT